LSNSGRGENKPPPAPRVPLLPPKLLTRLVLAGIFAYPTGKSFLHTGRTCLYEGKSYLHEGKFCLHEGKVCLYVGRSSLHAGKSFPYEEKSLTGGKIRFTAFRQI
jgi:hypothetical protein